MAAGEAFWRAIDWQRPWLAPYRALGERAAAALEGGATVAQALAREPAAPVRFVLADQLPRGEAYEAFIARTACVPTRDNLHDLFNGLVWLRWPQLKRHLNALHACEIARGPAASGVATPRGAARDTLTLFDENAALWQAPAVLLEALRRRDWQALFIQHRAAWQDARLTLFGHALLEKLTQPRKAITAHVYVLAEAAELETDAAEQLLAGLSASAPGTGPARPKPFLPLPVLGVPGWWPPNEAGNFYADESIFRQPFPAAAGDGLHSSGPAL